MYNDFIVRADYYPDGQIIPIGMTSTSGESTYIDRVIAVKKESVNKIIFRCRSKNLEFNLLYDNSRWIKE